MLEQINLTSISRKMYPRAAKYTFFSSAHVIFPRIDHMLGQNKVSISLRRLKLYQVSLLITMM